MDSRYGAENLCNEISSDKRDLPYRNPYRRDIQRLIHSPSFRRLQNKTQLFPGSENDFFRNRLTHSLEVAQISRAIAIKLKIEDDSRDIEEDVCEFSGLAHDLGHPPFGHQGEKALDKLMRNEGGFEGNAQTLRILTKLEKKIPFVDSKIYDPEKEYDDWIISGKDKRIGLNLTHRSIASIIKYNKKIPYEKISRPDEYSKKPMKGFYESESQIVTSVKKELTGKNLRSFKTIECSIMDTADDIAYSIYDLEDSLKAGFVKPIDMIFSNDELLKRVAKNVKDNSDIIVDEQKIVDTLSEIFAGLFAGIDQDSLTKEEVGFLAAQDAYTVSERISKNGYYRVDFTSQLVHNAIESIEFIENKKNPVLSSVKLSTDQNIKVNILKAFNYESQVLSPRLKISELKGVEVVEFIFKKLTSKDGWRLMPNDLRWLHDNIEKKYKKRVICDFISNMTDRYAIEFWARISSERAVSIFKTF